MKTLLAVLVALSLLANIALVGVLLAGRQSAGTSTAAAPVASQPAARASQADADAAFVANLAGTDLPALVQSLRDSGFPPHIIRAIVAARVQEQFAPRFKALRPDAATQAFWKTATVDPRIRAAEFALYREQQALLRQLLGADAEAPEASLYNQRRFETVPAAKLDAVKDALRELDERRQDIYSTAVNTITPEHQRKLAALEKEHQATLAGILSPDELVEFNVRNSDVARSLRFELTAFQPTEEEFRSIYKLQSQLEPLTGNLSQEEMQRRSEAQRQVREQVKAMLGPERAAEYERAIDYSYRQTSQLISRLELPPETTTKVWDVKQEVEKRANEIRRDSSLPPADRTKQLADLADEGTKRITALVGTRGIEAYKQGGGYWLRNLAPPAGGPAQPGPVILMRGP